MTGKPKRQRDNREGRVCWAGRREHRATGNVQVVNPVDSAVAVDHAPIRRVSHSRCAQMVETTMPLFESGCSMKPTRSLIANALRDDVIREQHDSRVLYGAAGQNILPRADLSCRTGRRSDAEALDRVRSDQDESR